MLCLNRIAAAVTCFLPSEEQAIGTHAKPKRSIVKPCELNWLGMVNNAVARFVVYVSGSPNGTATIEMAARVAQSFGASLLGMHVVESASAAFAPVPAVTLDPMSTEEFRRRAKARAGTAEAQFREIASKFKCDSLWLRIEDGVVSTRDQAAHAMHLADYIVAEQGAPGDLATNWQGRIEDSIVDGGRPLILHPRDWSDSVGEREALIAWKPTGEAARAVHDALPFLSRLERVTVTSVSDQEKPKPNIREPGKVLADYLEARGIRAISEPLFDIDRGKTGDALLQKAAGMGADLLVLGGYSHSRLREGLFGGVTRDVIENTAVPALISH